MPHVRLARDHVHATLIALTLLCGIALTGTVRAEMTPTEAVKEAIGEVLVILKNETYDREQRWAEIGKIIDARFDFRSMSQSVLASNWQEATTEEKRQFFEFFSQ